MKQVELDFKKAIEKRNRGMRSAIRHANDDSPGWQSRAVEFVRQYAVNNAEFMAEAARIWSELRGLPLPPTKKAWGPVMKQAEKENIVRAAGAAPAASSNGSYKVKWRSLVYQPREASA